MAALGGPVWNGDETRAFLGRLIDHWDSHGYGVWTMREKADGRFLGHAGLRRKMVEGLVETEFRCILRPESWGRGVATETARAVVGLSFRRLAVPTLVAFAPPAARPLRRVFEKTGFAHERDVIHAGRLHALYRQRRPGGVES